MSEDDAAAPPDADDAGWAARGRLRRGGHIPFGRGSKKVLELSLREAIRTGAHEIRTEHIALGVLHSDDEAVSMLIRTLGVDVQAVRADLEDHGRRTACARPVPEPPRDLYVNGPGTWENTVPRATRCRDRPDLRRR